MSVEFRAEVASNMPSLSRQQDGETGECKKHTHSVELTSIKNWQQSFLDCAVHFLMLFFFFFHSLIAFLGGEML